jgi:hypothetical protein
MPFPLTGGNALRSPQGSALTVRNKARTYTLNELLDLLREQAADLDDFTTPPPQDFSWKVDTNPARIGVEALTQKLSADPAEAWRTATDLRDAILALGYKLQGTCQVGVISEIGLENSAGPGWQLPICGWRGMVHLVMMPTSV